MLKTKIPLILLAAFLVLPNHAECQRPILPSVTISTTAAEPAESTAVDVQGDLIQAPDKVSPGRQFVARIKGDIPWTVTPADTLVIELLDRQGNVVLLISTEKADITISVSHQVVHPTPEEAQEALKDKATYAKFIREHSRDEVFQDSHVVKVGGGPDPEPDPDPDPDPEPEPKPEGPYWLIVVEETGKRSFETARIFTASAFWDSLKADGHKIRWYDDDQPGAKPFTQLTDKRPALIITTLSGQIVKVTDLPKTTDAIRELLK